MKILADDNFPGPLVEALRVQGHDVMWVRKDCPGINDKTLVERAESEGRIILTLDKDFWQLGLQRRLRLERSGVILFRAIPAIPRNLQPLLDSVLRSNYSWSGHLSIVTTDGIEMIPSSSIDNL